MTLSHTFPARYHGRCATCDEQITPGDTVGYDDDGALVHDDCDRAAPPVEKTTAPVCTVCWLTKPCGCDDEAATP